MLAVLVFIAVITLATFGLCCWVAYAVDQCVKDRRPFRDALAHPLKKARPGKHGWHG